MMASSKQREGVTKERGENPEGLCGQQFHRDETKGAERQNARQARGDDECEDEDESHRK
jgi:hypothetical protein